MGDNVLPLVQIQTLSAQAFETGHQILQYGCEGGGLALKFPNNLVQKSERLFRLSRTSVSTTHSQSAVVASVIEADSREAIMDVAAHLTRSLRDPYIIIRRA
jgi:hypothetical protein